MREFAATEVDEATTFYRSIDDPTAKAVFDLLIDHPDERLDGAAIAGKLALDRHRDVARATYRIGQLAASRGRPRPWTEAQLGYAMPAAQAHLFRRARAAATAGSPAT